MYTCIHMYICVFWMLSVKRQVNSQRKAQNDDFYFDFSFHLLLQKELP